MSSLRSRFTEQLTCSICHELFTTPKSLDCRHRFCEECLHDCIMLATMPQWGGVSCPTCRTLSKVPEDAGLNRQHWAGKYPTDFETNSMCDILRNDDETCPTHPEQQVLGFCDICKSCICEQCEHQCPGFKPLKIAVKQRTEHLQSLQRDCEEKSSRLNNQMLEIRVEKIRLEANYAKTTDKIKEEFDSIRVQLAQEEKRVLNHLHDIKNDQTRKLTINESGKRNKLNRILSVQGNIRRHLGIRSSVHFLENTKRKYEEFSDSSTDEPIQTGSFSKKTCLVVRPANSEAVRSFITNIIPEMTNLEDSVDVKTQRPVYLDHDVSESSSEDEAPSSHFSVAGRPRAVIHRGRPLNPTLSSDSDDE